MKACPVVSFLHSLSLECIIICRLLEKPSYYSYYTLIPFSKWEEFSLNFHERKIIKLFFFYKLQCYFFEIAVYLLQVFLNLSKEHICFHFSSKYTRTGTMQRRLSWSLSKVACIFIKCPIAKKEQTDKKTKKHVFVVYQIFIEILVF